MSLGRAVALALGMGALGQDGLGTGELGPGRVEPGVGLGLDRLEQELGLEPGGIWMATSWKGQAEQSTQMGAGPGRAEAGLELGKLGLGLDGDDLGGGWWQVDTRARWGGTRQVGAGARCVGGARHIGIRT
jgi:hypothetical protein